MPFLQSSLESSCPITVQQCLHAFAVRNLPFDFLNGPILDDVSWRIVLVREIRLPATSNMIECQSVFLIGIRLRIMLPDPVRKTGANRFWVLIHGRPIRVVLGLGIDEGHLLRTGDALVPTLCWHKWVSSARRVREMTLFVNNLVGWV